MTTNNRQLEVSASQSKPKGGQKILASKLIWLALYVVEFLIVLRIFLEFTSADPESLIVILISRLTSLLLVPFAGLIASITVGGKVLETSFILAMGVYALSAVAIERLVWLIFYRSRRPATTVTETTSGKRHTIP